jgi:hypothetical protein
MIGVASMAKKRTDNRFREAENARAIRTVLKGGAKIKNVIFRPGEIRIECGEEGEAAKAAEHNEWDEELYGQNKAQAR